MRGLHTKNSLLVPLKCADTLNSIPVERTENTKWHGSFEGHQFTCEELLRLVSGALAPAGYLRAFRGDAHSVSGALQLTMAIQRTLRASAAA